MDSEVHSFKDLMRFIHIESHRAGFVTDGPFHNFDKDAPRDADGRYPVPETWFECIWDDTGEKGEVGLIEIEWLGRTHP